MFEQLKQWMQIHAKEETPTESASEPANNTPSASASSSSPPAKINTLEDVAAAFANSLMRPPRTSSDTTIAGDLEREVYGELLKLLKEGVEPDSLPKCPTTITQLLQVLADDDSSFNDVTKLINQDPVMASEIIKLSNSALFRPKAGEVTSVESAAQMLGMDKLSAMASTIMMKRIMSIQPIYFKYFGSYLWDHSQQCALACGYLAEKSGQDYFSAYLIGLVHDIGKLVIFQELIKALRKAHPDVHPNEKVMASIVDRMSAQLSCVSLKHWDLPITIQTAICEQAKKKHPEDLTPMAYILFTANILSEIWLLLSKGYIDEVKTRELLEQYDLPFEALEELFNMGVE